MVKLAEGQVIDKLPVLPSVAGNVQSPVIAVDDVLRIVRADPESVVVGVHPVVGQQHFEGLPAVFRSRHHRIQVVQPVFIFRIDENICVVKRPVADILRGHDLPVVSAVIGSVEGVFLFRLDEGVHDGGFGAGDSQADAAERAFGQALLVAEPGEAVAAVIAHIQAGAFAAGAEVPGGPGKLPHGHDQFVGMPRIDDHIGDAGAVVDVQHFLPVFPSVAAAVQSPVGGGAPGGSHGADPDRVGFIAVHDDAVYEPGIFEAGAAPGPAAVDAVVQAAAAVVRVARVALAGADPEFGGVVRVEGDGADGLHRLVIKNGSPGGATVVRQPQPPAGSAHPYLVVVVGVHGDSGDPPAHPRRPDAAGLDTLQPGAVERLCRQPGRSQEYGGKQGEAIFHEKK